MTVTRARHNIATRPTSPYRSPDTAARRHNLLLRSGLWLVACLLTTSTPAQQILLTKDAKRECATCHLDWVDSFDRPGAIPLIDRPTKPQSAEEPMCLGCHDGSVGDSRRGVWLEHGHRRGNEKPSDKIKIPPHMPTDEQGHMVCRTCHTAHTVPGANDLSRIVFLRYAREGGLCQQCHVDRSYGAEHGSHPLAKLPFELPKEISEAHGRTDIADRSRMACQTCHTAHGAQRENLLVLGTESGQLCKSCHEKLRPTQWLPDAPREHPQNPPLKTDKQRQAIKDMGTRLGPNDTLVCFSCHKMHDSKSGKYMLADTLQDSALCIRCHEDRKLVLESKHDLRKTRPDEKNKLGMTPDQSGPCGSCHSFHQYARETKPGAGDPVGLCISCHRPKDKNAGVASGPATTAAPIKPVGFAHPSDIDSSKLPKAVDVDLLNHGTDPSKKSFACYTCHDPHRSDKKLFLRKERDDLCSTCHTDRFASMAGKHDFTGKPELKNAKGQNAQESGKCGFCHAVHGDTDLVLWVGTKERPKSPDDLCLQCHRKGGLAHDKPAFAYSHPTGPEARPSASRNSALGTQNSLPLFNDRALIDPNGYVSCASCHDPHANSQTQKEMLRVPGTVTNLCTRCHADYANMAKGPHDSRDKKEWPIKLDGKSAKEGDLCLTCHRPHSNDPERQRYAFIPAKGFARADGACLACHGKAAWATAFDPGNPDGKVPLGRAMHPTTMPATGHAGTLASGLPLIRKTGGAPADSIGCKTCHNPHASSGTAHLTRTMPGQPSSALCTKCHTETAGMASSMHAADALAPHAAEFIEKGLKSPSDPKSPTCSPCHSTHAIETSQRPYLWAAKSLNRSASESDNRCLSCHDPSGGEGGRKLLVEHPAEPLAIQKWAATQPAKVPTDEANRIRCVTCHVSHGDPTAHGAGDSPDLDTRRATRPMLRPGASKQCARCHGVDASRNWLYWHDPAKRRSAGLLLKPATN